MTSSPRLLLLVPLVLALACGCGSNRATPARLSGHVNYGGKPVTGGSIKFFPKDGGVYPAGIDVNGEYSIADLPAGQTAVSIETESAKGGSMQEYSKARGAQPPKNANSAVGGNEPAAPATKYVKIPAKYANPTTSGLSVELTRGKQVKDFELSD
jgi:hypothetical protein